MIQNSFIHIPGIGKATEKKLWDQGISDWSLFEKAYEKGEKLPHARRVLSAIETSRAHLEKGDLAYFGSLFPASEAWRLYPGNENRTCYLDIETTGDGSFCDITTIALFDGRRVQTFVRGENLDRFKEAIRAFDAVVTYNGKSFDVPVIQREMHLAMGMAHIDLRYVLGHLGIKGGLKKCEKTLGLDRNELEGLDGYAAVLMWRAYKIKKDPKYLETLLAYNVADTINLAPLLHEACRRHALALPEALAPSLRPPDVCPNPHQADRQVIREMRQIHSHF